VVVDRVVGFVVFISIWFWGKLTVRICLIGDTCSAVLRFVFKKSRLTRVVIEVWIIYSFDLVGGFVNVIKTVPLHLSTTVRPLIKRAVLLNERLVYNKGRFASIFRVIFGIFSWISVYVALCVVFFYTVVAICNYLRARFWVIKYVTEMGRWAVFFNIFVSVLRLFVVPVLIAVFLVSSLVRYLCPDYNLNILRWARVVLSPRIVVSTVLYVFFLYYVFNFTWFRHFVSFYYLSRFPIYGHGYAWGEATPYSYTDPATDDFVPATM